MVLVYLMYEQTCVELSEWTNRPLLFWQSQHPPKDDIDININVIVPPGRPLPSFSTYLPRFHQQIGEPGPNILKLGNVELGGPVEQLTMYSVCRVRESHFLE